MTDKNLIPEDLKDTASCKHVAELAAFRRFYDAVVRIASAKNFDDAFEIAAEAALDVTRSDSSLVAIVRGGRIELAKHRNIPKRALDAAAKADIMQTFFGTVLETGRPMAFTPADVDSNLQLRGGHPGGGAICAVPAVYEGKPLGVIGVRRSETEPYTNAEVRALNALGAVVGAIAATHAAAEDARHANMRYSAMLKWLPGTAYVLSADGTITFLSDNFRRVSGMDPEKFLKHDFSALVHPDDVSRLREVLARARDNLEPITEVDYRIRTASGGWTLRRASVGPLYGPDGQLEGFIGFARDVSEEEGRRRVLEAIPRLYATMRACSNLEDLCKSVAEAVVQQAMASFAAIWVPADGGGAMLEACFGKHVGAADVKGYVAKEGLAVHAATNGVSVRGTIDDEPLLASLCKSDSPPNIGLIVADVASSPAGTRAVLEVGFEADDPLAPAVANHISLLTSHLAAAISEMEARQELEQTNRRLMKVAAELERKAHQLEEANAELEGFVYVASHDLKAPLTSISGMAALLQRYLEDTADEKAQHYIERIRANVDHLSQMIDDLLELSRVGRIEEPVTDVYVDQVIEEVLEMLAPNLDDIQVHRPAGWPVVRVSRTRLQQVFANLISNAIKYGCSGQSRRIELGWDDRDGYYEFFVRDFGPGIPEEYKQVIFRLFERGPAQDQEGSGIGLSLAQKIVRHYGGRLWVESEPGQGATFRFTLPKPEPASEGVQAA